MIQLGFFDVFVNLIMACLSSISYSVLLNGQPVGNIKPSRGLRKGELYLHTYFFCVQWGYKAY